MAEKKATERLAEVTEKLGPMGETIFKSSSLNRRGLDAEEAKLQARLENKTNEIERAELERLEKVAPLTARHQKMRLAGQYTAADIFEQANKFGLRQEEQLLKSGTTDLPPTAA